MIGAKVDNAGASMLGRLSSSGGVNSHLADTTRTSVNFGATVNMGETTGQAVGKVASDAAVGSTQKAIEKNAGLWERV